MDDNFTTGPDDDKLSTARLTSIDRRLDTMAVDLRALVLDRREISVAMMELNRSLQRRALEMSSDTQRLRDSAQVWEMYADLQKRMDRMALRLAEIERKLDPPLSKP